MYPTPYCYEPCPESVKPLIDYLEDMGEDLVSWLESTDVEMNILMDQIYTTDDAADDSTDAEDGESHVGEGMVSRIGGQTGRGVSQEKKTVVQGNMLRSLREDIPIRVADQINQGSTYKAQFYADLSAAVSGEARVEAVFGINLDEIRIHPFVTALVAMGAFAAGLALNAYIDR